MCVGEGGRKKKHLKPFSNPNPGRPPEYQSGITSICGGMGGRFPSNIRIEMPTRQDLALFFRFGERGG